MKTIRALFDAVNSGDVDLLASFYAEDVVVDMTESVGPDNQVYDGREAARAMWTEQMEQWESWTWELENITDLPPDRVVVANRVCGRGRGSGIEVNARVGQLWRLAGGQVAYVKMFQTEAEALDAAGADGADAYSGA